MGGPRTAIMPRPILTARVVGANAVAPAIRHRYDQSIQEGLALTLTVSPSPGADGPNNKSSTVNEATLEVDTRGYF